MLKTFFKNTGISHKVLYSLIYNFEIHYQVTLEIFHAFKLHCFNAIWLQIWQILLFKKIIISTNYLEKLPDAFGVFMTKTKSTSKVHQDFFRIYYCFTMKLRQLCGTINWWKFITFYQLGGYFIYYVRDKMRY